MHVWELSGILRKEFPGLSFKHEEYAVGRYARGRVTPQSADKIDRIVRKSLVGVIADSASRRLRELTQV